MIHQRMADRFSARQPAFGTSLRFNDPAIMEMIGGGWDFVWIDLQHGTIGPEHLMGIIRACDLVGLTSLVRLPLDPSLISFSLDMDAGGVLVAQIDTPQQARAAVEAAKFPPLGNRSYGGRRIIDRNGRDYTARANRDQLLIAQIESPQALENAPAIAEIEGVDGLMLGPDDIRVRLGTPLSAPLLDGTMLDISRRIAEAARQSGKHAMVIVQPRQEDIAKAAGLGFDMISLGADATFLKQGSAAMLAEAATFRSRT